MRQLDWRVSRIRPCVDAAGGNDAEEKDRVPDIVERVNANAVSLLQSQGLKARDELADNGAGSTGGDVVGWVEGVDVDLLCVSVLFVSCHTTFFRLPPRCT